MLSNANQWPTKGMTTLLYEVIYKNIVFLYETITIIGGSDDTRTSQ